MLRRRSRYGTDALHRAQGRVQAAKPYSEKVTDVIANLAGGGAGVDHPLLAQPGDINRCLRSNSRIAFLRRVQQQCFKGR